jgi:integrase
MRDEIVSKNPIRLASQLSTRNKVKEVEDIEPFTMEQIQKLISNCENEQMKNFYMFLFTTGVRGGEAIGLEWKNVDFFNKTIEIKVDINKNEHQAFI